MATLTATNLVQAAQTSSISTAFFANNALFTASSSAGDKFTNTGNQIVLFQNSSSQGGGSAVVVGITGQVADNLGGAAALHTLSVSVPSSSFGITVMGPFSPASYNDANGMVNITYSAGGLYVAVLNVAPRS